MSFLFKKIITSLVLGSFLFLVLFSFASMFHIPGQDMPGDCLLNVSGKSLCPQDTLSLAVYHISSYQSFLNVSVGYSIIAIAYLLLVVYAFTFFVTNPDVFRFCVRTNHFNDSWPGISYNKGKIRCWLSLFENSPSYHIDA